MLTDWSMYANYPDWRPGSDEIVFSTYGLGEFQATDEPSNLYTIKSDGSGLDRPHIVRQGRAASDAADVDTGRVADHLHARWSTGGL